MSVSALRESLLRWYDANQRPLPWRRGVSPYRTWVSEVMLQQTTVAVVIPYFQRFLRRFPDIASLARASETSVLRAWAGLGYYSRARNLHRAAREIMARHQGVFPRTYEEILDLPGIGRYTAGAILSIAFSKPAPILDGNVIRVLTRLYAIKGDAKRPPILARLWALAETLVCERRPGDFNQALMELGATVCLPESPLCGECPLALRCQAKFLGAADRFPETGSRRKPIPLRWTCLWIRRGDKVLLWKRSAGERLLKAHWGLPEARHLKVNPQTLLKTVSHSITHHRISVEVRAADAPSRLPASAAWVSTSRLRKRLVSSLWLKCLPRS